MEGNRAPQTKARATTTRIRLGVTYLSSTYRCRTLGRRDGETEPVLIPINHFSSFSSLLRQELRNLPSKKTLATNRPCEISVVKHDWLSNVDSTLRTCFAACSSRIYPAKTFDRGLRKNILHEGISARGSSSHRHARSSTVALHEQHDVTSQLDKPPLKLDVADARSSRTQPYNETDTLGGNGRELIGRNRLARNY